MAATTTWHPSPGDLAGDDSRGALHPTRTLLPIAEMAVTARERYVNWAFAIETEEDWATTLATVTLSGPQGSFVADATGSGRGAIITDRATGRIISIVRDWDGVLDREGVFPRVLGSRVDVAIHRSLPLVN